MKVSIDGILGTARKINSQKELTERETARKAEEPRSDSVSISGRLNTRLDAIESELKSIQVSLAKYQTIRDGIEQLQADAAAGGARQREILDAVVFEGRPVLKEFVGEAPSAQNLTQRYQENEALIADNIGRLKRLQVELDNMTASNLVGQERVAGITAGVESVFAGADSVRSDHLSSLNRDSVMRLIR